MTDYKPDTVYTIALMNPSPGIETTIADEIARRPTLSTPQTMRLCDGLVLISYGQQQADDMGAVENDRSHVDDVLESLKVEYLILSSLTMLNFMDHDFCGQLYSEP